MSTSDASVVLWGRDGRVLVGHVAVGNGVAGLMQQRREDPSRSHTAAVVGGGTLPMHGANGGGLVCIALDAGGQALVAAALEGAGRVDEVAVALDRARRGGPDVMIHAGTLLAADAGGASVVAVGEDGVVATHEAAVDGLPGGGGWPDMGAADGAAHAEAGTAAAAHAEAGTAAADAPVALLHSLITRVRQVEPSPQEGATPVAGLAAVLTPGAPPQLHFALGPPSCAVFVRHWPGFEVGPDEAATPEGAPLARLAAAVAQATGTDPDLRRAARERLDRAEATALGEGEAAERMAARMDADTDDWGATVRRLVAQAHAAGVAREALEELAVPAPPGSHR